MEVLDGTVEKAALVHLAVATFHGLLTLFFIFSLSLGMLTVYGLSVLFGALFSVIMTVWHLATANHLKRYGRNGIRASLLPSITLLVLFPVGTILGVYLLSVSIRIRENGRNT